MMFLLIHPGRSNLHFHQYTRRRHRHHMNFDPLSHRHQTRLTAPLWSILQIHRFRLAKRIQEMNFRLCLGSPHRCQIYHLPHLHCHCLGVHHPPQTLGMH